ncbi:MAG TPA: DUF1552 domain-containing protein, partial [Bryobacteraceae bacterium]|nr:DUF1552 domain-containing protein [Bryobacteraceae bacterium]
MMFVTRRHLPRRMFLKGAGTAIALPLLDAMIPALSRAAAAKPPARMAFMYAPNGIIMDAWTPNSEGRNFEFPRILKSLEPFREDLLVLTGLAHRTGDGSAGDHTRASATYLTGVGPKRTTSADVEVGISVDQVAARAIGGKTRLPSMELGCEVSRAVGSCDAGYSCAYINSMSWRGPSTPNPPETNPRLVFERLFGSLAMNPDPALRARMDEDRRSVLDSVNERTRSLMAELGPSDRRKIDEYLSSLREIEKRISSAGSDRGAAPEIEKPSGVPPGFVEHARLMNDLLLIAFQADITRVATLIYSKESSTRSYPELGFSDPHHPLTHHRNNPELIEKVTRINCHHLDQFADFIRKAKAIREGDGTLLDHSMLVYGSSIS